MLPGFLPFAHNSTFMLDVVVVAMVAVLPILSFSIYTVRVKKNYLLHKRLQILLGSILLLAVLLFEIEMRLAGGWRPLAKDSPYYGGLLDWELKVHLFFSVSTFVLWLITMILALRRFPSPPRPSAHSILHKRLAWISTIFMYSTAVTGWLFYYLAFVAR